MENSNQANKEIITPEWIAIQRKRAKRGDLGGLIGNEDFLVALDKIEELWKRIKQQADTIQGLMKAKGAK